MRLHHRSQYYVCISFLDLPAPVVTVKATCKSTAGKNYSLVCSVETVDGVRPRDISITWITPDKQSVMGTGLTTNGTVTTGTHKFSPLMTSDGGRYTCTGRITDENVGVDVSSYSSVQVNVTSKLGSSLKINIAIVSNCSKPFGVWGCLNGQFYSISNCT